MCKYVKKTDEECVKYTTLMDCKIVRNVVNYRIECDMNKS